MIPNTTFSLYYFQATRYNYNSEEKFSLVEVNDFAKHDLKVTLKMLKEGKAEKLNWPKEQNFGGEERERGNEKFVT